MPVSQEKGAPEAKRQQGRSPAYPTISLARALEKAKTLYETEGKYAVPLSSAFKAWGYGEKSSGGRQTKASLRYFGLVESEGEGDKIKLTAKALRVLLDEREDQTEKNALIREFALNPGIHMEIFKKFPEGIKSDATVEHFLIFDKEFNATAAKELVAEFKATATLAQLFEPAKALDKIDEKPENHQEPTQVVVVGDFVQWTANGSLQFKAPKRVRAVKDHEGQPWVFVDGEVTGMPMEQVTVEKKSVDAAPTSQAPTLALDDEPKQLGTRKEVTSLDEGQAMLIWPENLTADSFHDLDHWLKGILQKAKRRAGIKDEKKPSHET